MKEVSDERLAYLEALEQIVKQIIEPDAQAGYDTTEMEKETRFARHWTDAQIEENMAGSAIWDDPPKGWRRSTLLTYSRGYLTGRAIVGGNVGQYFRRCLKAVADPIQYWYTWQLGVLQMVEATPCSMCHVKHGIDTVRMGLVCPLCHAFHSYEEIQQQLSQ